MFGFECYRLFFVYPIRHRKGHSTHLGEVCGNQTTCAWKVWMEALLLFVQALLFHKLSWRESRYAFELSVE